MNYSRILSRNNILRSCTEFSICRWKHTKEIIKHDEPDKGIKIIEIPDENSELPKKHVFQEIRKIQNSTPIYTIEEAAEPRPSESILRYFRYSNLSTRHSDAEYALRSVDNEFTIVHQFPEVTDFLIIGAGLIGSASAYYLKKATSRGADVLVLDKEPYSPNNCTAICNGLITSQSKNKDISRLGTLSKELLRNLRNEVLCTDEDFAQINYRPCTHLILWPQNEVDEVLKSVDIQMEDGCFTDTKLPGELEAQFPWLKAVDTDIALGTHGNQDEALVDPIGLRNLYRTLAQGYGASFVMGEVIDFNTIMMKNHPEICPDAAGAIVARNPRTGELRNVGFAKTLLALGHNTPYLEARSEMEAYMRDQIDDLHFLQPRLRVSFAFHSLATPLINFPVITDVDGSVLIREDFSGNFKYYLNYEDSEYFLDQDISRFMNLDSEEPYPNLIHKNEMFADHFNNVIKAKLVKRIPLMEDAEFDFAYSGFESFNSHDGSPVIGQHPFHNKVILSAGYGPRMMTFAPAIGAINKELFLGGEEETYDLTPFYWNRVIKNRIIREFRNLVQ